MRLISGVLAILSALVFVQEAKAQNIPREIAASTATVADWELVTRRVEDLTKSDLRNRKALNAISVRLGLSLRKNGAPDIPAILTALDESLRTIQDLRAEIERLKLNAAPDIAKLWAQADTAISLGDLAGARTLLDRAKAQAAASTDKARRDYVQSLTLSIGLAEAEGDRLLAAADALEAARVEPARSDKIQWTLTGARLLVNETLQTGNLAPARQAIDVLDRMKPLGAQDTVWQRREFEFALGKAYWSLATFRADGDASEAIVHLNAALFEPLTSADRPQRARLLVGLATIYAERAWGDGGVSVPLAVPIYRDALEQIDPKTQRDYWFEVRGYLAGTLRLAGADSDGPDRRAEAVKILEEDRAQLDPERDFRLWILTTSALEAALRARANGDRIDNLDQRRKLNKSLDTEQVRQAAPMEWASALTMWALDNAEGHPSALTVRESLNAYERAEKVVSLERLPLDWAGYQIGHADLLLMLGGSADLEAARTRLEKALQILSVRGQPDLRARAEFRLGRTLVFIGVQRSEAGENPIATYQAAIEHSTRCMEASVVGPGRYAACKSDRDIALGNIRKWRRR